MTQSGNIAELRVLLAQLEVEWPGSSDAKQASAGRIGELVSALRTDLGWNVERLAYSADVNPSLIYRLEAGTKLPSRFRLARVVDSLAAEVGDTT